MKKLLEYLDAERGRRNALAASLNIAPSAISQWRVVPIGRVLDVERITGIDRAELRPDVFGPGPDMEAAE